MIIARIASFDVGFEISSMLAASGMVLNLSCFSCASLLPTPPIQYCEIIQMVCNGRADDVIRSLASSSPVLASEITTAS